MAERIDKDLEFLQEWDGESIIIFMVRSHIGQPREHGFLTSKVPTIELGYAYDGGNGNYLKYESFEQMLADGWTVD